MPSGRSHQPADTEVDVGWVHIERPGAGVKSDLADQAPGPRSPSRRVAAMVVLAFVALIGAYGLGRSSGPAPQLVSAPTSPPATSAPTATPAPTSTPQPTPTPPELVELLGEGSVLDELDLSDGSRAVIWCRETVPGTRIAPTLALVHLEANERFGEQLVAYEELTTPWVPNGTSWRGGLDTEGFGADSGTLVGPDGTEVEGLPGDGTRCKSCASSRITLATAGTILYGDCVHGQPFRAGMAYIIASPRRPGQTPLAVHASCGITSLVRRGDRFLIEAEAPLVRGLTDARFRFPPIELTHRDDRFWADELELFDWACELDRSTQLADRHLLPGDSAPALTYDLIETSIGILGVHGPMIVGLDLDQCSHLTRAWWGMSTAARSVSQPIADLLEVDPPPGERDWYYTCQPR